MFSNLAPSGNWMLFSIVSSFCLAILEASFLEIVMNFVPSAFISATAVVRVHRTMLFWSAQLFRMPFAKNGAVRMMGDAAGDSRAVN